MLFRHKYRLSWCIMVLGLALATGCSLLPSEEEPLKPPLVKPPQENYRTVEVVRGDISQNVRGNGTLESYYSESARFTVAGGRIKEVFVRAGDQVKKGDVLVQLNVDGLDIEVKQLQLNMLRSLEALRQARQGGNDSAMEIAQLQYEIDKMKYDRTNSAYIDKQLVAGMDGQVTFVDNVQEGDYVDAYRTLVIISDPTKLRLAFQTDSSQDVASIAVGFTAELKFGGNVTLEGTVSQTPSSAPFTEDEALRRRYSSMVFVELEQLPDNAVIGSRADVTIRLQERKDVLLLPRSGLRNYLGRTFVRVLEDGDKIREVDVEVGITGSTELEIAQGLKEGELIVLP